MLLQKAQIGKTAVIFFILLLLVTLVGMPLFIRADATGEATPEAGLFLPVIFKEADGTPNPGAEATLTPTLTPSATPSSTATSPSWCQIQFAKEAFGNTPYVLITGDVGIEVTITNLTTNEVIGSGILNGPVVGQDCPGFSSITVTPRLDETHVGHILRAEQTDNPENFDTTVVLDAYNPQPTSTPNAPYLAVVPNCGPGPDVQFKVEGFNWPMDQSLTLSWVGMPQVVFPANEHSGFFILTWTFEGLADGVYTVSALSGTNGVSVTDQVYIPCDLLPIDTPIPGAVDLIVGQPVLVSTPPITVYEPVAFQVPVTNTGDISIESLFFVDLLFDPQSAHPTDVYAAVSGLAGNSSITLTITSDIGFANFVGTHQVTGWVDSLDHVTEEDETNNLSESLDVSIANYGGTPTNTPIPNGTATISGVANILLHNIIPQERMLVSAIDESSGLTVATTYSDENGFYQFNNLTNGASYTVTACLTIDNNQFFGIHTNRVAPNAFGNIFANEGACP